MSETTETHPWKWHTPAGCTALIIGTFPTAAQNRAFDFFYPNPRNLFWPVLSAIGNHRIRHLAGTEAVAERQQLLLQLRLGVTDMGLRVLRKGAGSTDDKLTLVEYMNLHRLLEENPNIKKLILTSSSGKASALGWFSRYAAEAGWPMQLHSPALPRQGTVTAGNKTLELVVLPSTSPAAAQGLEKLVRLYQQELQL